MCAVSDRVPCCFVCSGALLADGRPPLNGLAPAGSLPDLTPGGFTAPPPPPPRAGQEGDDLSRTPPYSVRDAPSPS